MINTVEKIKKNHEGATTPMFDLNERGKIKGFVCELEKTLRRQLHTQSECVQSRRIEGQLTRKTVMMPFNQAVIMIDTDVDNINYGLIVTGLCEFVKNDRYFKFTRYNIVLWMNKNVLNVCYNCFQDDVFTETREGYLCSTSMM